MSRKKFLPFVLLILLIFSACTQIEAVSAATASSNAVLLKVYCGPTSVLADNQAYNAVVVQLQNSRGTPVRALEDTVISLSSALTNIGDLNPAITIYKGETYAVANFYSTFTPGTTTITATASGYVTVQASITTVGPSPSTLAVFGFPSVLPADGNSYNALVVQLQDSSGSPAPAPIEGVEVTLSSSNTTIAAADSSVIIEGGKTYAVAGIKTTNHKAGSAVITTIASGYSSKQVTITTQNISTSPIQPTNLKIYLGPPKVLANGETYEQVAVQLQNSSAKIVRALETMTITLSSAIEEVGIVEQTITLPQGETFATAQFSTTFKSGTTTITAAATNCTSNQVTLTTLGPISSKLAVYCTPSALPSDGKSYDMIQVQLQDSRGKPAKDPLGDVTVYLFSSAPNAGNSSSTITIPFGQTYAAATFFTTCTANVTTITAQASGYSPGQARITTSLIDQYTLNVTLSADSNSIGSNGQTTLRAYISYNGSDPATRVNLNFNSTKGGNFTTLREEGNGYYSVVFKAPKVTKLTVCTITANATKAGYISTNGTLQITVNVNASGTRPLQLLIVDDNGNPISEASITSQTQPAGAAALSGTTNETGYITFANTVEGNYTIQINKDGYEEKTQTIHLQTIQNGTNQPSQYTINLTKSATESSLPIPIIGAIVIVAVIVALIIIKKRKKAAQPVETQPAKKTRRKKQEE